MAVVKGILFEDVSGKVGNIAGQRGAAGQVARKRVKPRNPQTPDQARQRALQSAIASRWPTLDEGARRQWNELAKDKTGSNRFGDRLKFSGMNLFTAANANARLVGGTANIDTPPEVTPVTPPFIDGISAGGEITLTGALPTGYRVAAFASKPTSPGRNNAPVAFIGYYSTLGTGNTIDITGAYEDKYGAWPSGKKVFVELALISPTTGARFRMGRAMAVTA
jgi:hypothetical protein